MQFENRNAHDRKCTGENYVTIISLAEAILHNNTDSCDNSKLTPANWYQYDKHNITNTEMLKFSSRKSYSHSSSLVFIFFFAASCLSAFLKKKFFNFLMLE